MEELRFKAKKMFLSIEELLDNDLNIKYITGSAISSEEQYPSSQ